MFIGELLARVLLQLLLQGQMGETLTTIEVPSPLPHHLSHLTLHHPSRLSLALCSLISSQSANRADDICSLISCSLISSLSSDILCFSLYLSLLLPISVSCCLSFACSACAGAVASSRCCSCQARYDGSCSSRRLQRQSTPAANLCATTAVRPCHCGSV